MHVIEKKDQRAEEKVFPGERRFFDGLKSFIDKTKDRVGKTLGGGNNKKGGSSCNTGFQEMNPPKTKATGGSEGLGKKETSGENRFFEGMESFTNETNKDPTGKSAGWSDSLGEKKEVKKDTLLTIDREKLITTSNDIVTENVKIPYGITIFDKEGLGAYKIEKNSEVRFSSGKIKALYDEKTGKYQAYAIVSHVISSKDASGRTFENLPVGAIARVPWLDSVVNRVKKPTVAPQEKKGKMIPLDRFYGHNKKPIPEEYLIKAINIHLIENEILLLENTLAKINQNLAGSGRNIANEASLNKVPLKKTSGYEAHLKNLALKKTYERATQEIRSFTMNDQEVMGPTVASIVSSLQRKPIIWNGILNKATFISNKYDEAQRRARVNGYKN